MFRSSHRQHLLVAFRHLDETFAEVLRQLGAAPGAPLFARTRSDVDADARARVAAAIEGVRGEVRAFMARHDLAASPQSHGATHVARSRLDLALVAAGELGPRHLRGYGDLTEAEIDALDQLAGTLCDQIAAAITILPERPASSMLR